MNHVLEYVLILLVLLVGLAPPLGLPALWLGTVGYTAIALWCS